MPVHVALRHAGLSAAGNHRAAAIDKGATRKHGPWYADARDRSAILTSAMACVGVAVALFAYEAQAPDELSIREGDSLYLLELVDGEWYRSRQRFVGEDGILTSTETPAEGLVPANYVQEVAPSRTVRAMYDYEAQGDDELTFADGEELSVYESADDWALARNSAGVFGLIPENYVEPAQETAPAAPPAPAACLLYTSDAADE